MKTERVQKILSWAKGNCVCLGLTIIFAVIYFFTSQDMSLYEKLASMDLEFINGEYYRYITAEWIHYDNLHIVFNCAALISVGSLLTPFIGKGKTFFIFFVTATFAEIIFSQIISHGEIVYIGGSSGGIFGLIGVLLLCSLRFPKEFVVKWYRPDVLMVVIFFIFANNIPDNFLTHVFGFFTGIVMTYVLIVAGVIKEKRPRKEEI